MTVFDQGFERLPKRFQLPKRVQGGEVLARRLGGRNAYGGVAGLRPQRAVMEEGDGESDAKDEAQARRGQEERPPRGAGFDACATSAHGGAIGQQYVVEQVTEKEPLRNLAGGAHLRRGWRRRRCLAHMKDAGGARRRTVSGRRLRRGRPGRDLVDDDGAHAGEVKSAQERSHGQLAGLAYFNQELPPGGAHLPNPALYL